MGNLKKQFFSGVFYTAVAKYSGIVLSLVVVGILSRLLTPDDFGVVAISTVFINFFCMFANVGFSSAIVQKKELTNKDLSGIFMFSLWMGIFLGIIFFLLSWPIAFLYKRQELLNICQIMSIVPFLSSALIVPNSLFNRDKRFKFIAFRTLVIQIVTGIIAIGVAFSGGGLYTLLIQPVLSNLVLLIVALYNYPQSFRMTSGINEVKKIWSYSFYQFLFNIVAYFVTNLDKFLIGKVIGMRALGYYEKSYRLMSIPVQNITHIITPVLHPMLSDYQHDSEKLRDINERMTHLLAYIGFPLSVLLFFCSKEIVLILFGNQWMLSVPAFRILSLSVGLQIVMSSSGSFYQSLNDTKSLFYCGMFNALVTCSGYLICIVFSKEIESFAYTILICYTLSFLQCYFLMYKKLFRKGVLIFYKSLSSSICLSIIIAAILYVFSFYVVGTINPFFSLLIKASMAFLLWILFSVITNEFDAKNRIINLFAKNT